MKLVVALATRSRPEVLVQALRSLVECSTEPETEIIVLADNDDPKTVEAVQRAKLDKVSVSFEQREDSLGAKYNRVLGIAKADVYQVAVDYALMQTKGYDKRVLEAASLFPDGIGCVYGPPANASFPTVQAPTAKLVELMGGIYPEWFPFWFVDHWLDDVCKVVQRIATVDLQIDCNKLRSASTTELRDVGFWATLFDVLRGERRAQVERIISALDEPEWRKKLLRNNHHRVEVRSLWINSGVKQQAVEIEKSRGAGEPDARYRRIKAAGERKLKETIAKLEAEMGAEAAKHVAQQHPKEIGWLLQHLKGVKSVLEVGSCHGNNLKLFSEVAAPGARFRAIDLGELPGAREGLMQVKEDLKAKGFDADVCFADSHSLATVAWAKAEGPFDVVFIDGDHSYEGVKQDWVNYGGLGKVVVFHDVVHPECGVKELWSEIEKYHVTVKKVESSMGLGIVFPSIAA